MSYFIHVTNDTGEETHYGLKQRRGINITKQGSMIACSCFCVCVVLPRAPSFSLSSRCCSLQPPPSICNVCAVLIKRRPTNDPRTLFSIPHQASTMDPQVCKPRPAEDVYVTLPLSSGNNTVKVTGRNEHNWLHCSCVNVLRQAAPPN